MPESRPVSFVEFAQVVERMTGRVAWQSRASSATGSIFTLHFDRASIGDDDSDRWAEFLLMVFCAWRIVAGDKILVSWQEDGTAALAPALQALEGQTVISGAFSAWGDLTIHFADGRQLQVWNDDPFEEGNSWWLGYQGHGHYAVEACSRLTYTSREEENYYRSFRKSTRSPDSPASSDSSQSNPFSPL